MTGDETSFEDVLDSSSEEEDRNIKIILLGDDLTGVEELIKNALARLTIKEQIDDENYRIEYEGEEVYLTINYTDGKEKMRSLTTTFFKKANVVFVVYQSNKPETAEHLNCWSKEIDRYAENDIPRKLLGLRGTKQFNEVISANQFAEENLITSTLIDFTDPTQCSQLLLREIEDGVPKKVVIEPELPKKKGKKNSCCLVM